MKKIIKTITDGPQSCTMNLYSQEIGQYDRKDFLNKKDVTIRRLTSDDWGRLEQLRDKRVKEAFINMTKKEYMCYGAFDEENIIGHAVCTLPKEKLSSFIIQEAAYIHYCYVNPEHRGNNIYPMMLDFIICELKKEYSYKRVYIATALDNTASQKGLLKAGFVFELKWTSYSWWRFHWCRKKL